VSKLTTDVVTYCTEASNQKSKYAYRKILFYKKSTANNRMYISLLMSAAEYHLNVKLAVIS